MRATIDMKTYLPPIAAALGAGWKVKPPMHANEDPIWTYGELVGPDGETITVGQDTYRQRVILSGDLDHKYLRHGQSRPSITVAPSKTPAQVAADIRRRLLPDYLPLLAAQKERVAADNAHDAASVATAERLYAIVSGHRWVDRRDEYQRKNGNDCNVSLHGTQAEPLGDFRCSGTRVYFDRVSLSADEAAVIISALAAYRQANPSADE